MNDHKDVVVVEDNVYVRQSIQQLLDYAGYNSRIYDSAESLMNDEIGSPQFCIFDFRLPGINGLGLLEHYRKLGHDFPAILVSGNFDPLTNEKVLDLGAVTCIQKPFRPDDFFKTIEEMTSSSTATKPEESTAPIRNTAN